MNLSDSSYNDNDILQHCTSSNQVNLYQILLQHTTQVLKTENAETLQPKAELQQALRQKVALKQAPTIIEQKSLIIPIASKPNCTHTHSYTKLPMSIQSAAAIVLVLMGFVFARFLPNKSLNNTTVAQDTVLLQHHNTMLNTDTPSLKIGQIDTVLR